MQARRGHRRLLESAAGIQRSIDATGMGSASNEPVSVDSWVARFDLMVSSEPLRTASRDLFVNGHYAQAVEEGFKCLNNAVKDKARKHTVDGDSLMRTVFSAKSPVLKLNQLRTKSQEDEQRGYMDIYAGAMTGIRNPRAHEHQTGDGPEAGLEMLVLANHLMRKLQTSSKARRRKTSR
jgi:uncharacterized protein (TIGR02391 family)